MGGSNEELRRIATEKEGVRGRTKEKGERATEIDGLRKGEGKTCA